MKNIVPAVLLIFLLTLSALASAEQAVRDNGFVVHYAALVTTDLSPEVAKQFGVERNRRNALLVLNAQQESSAHSSSPRALAIPVPAQGSGYVETLIGQRQPLALRAIREGDVHYLIAEFQAIDQQTMRFVLQVRPEGATQDIEIRFHQQFFHDRPSR